MPTNRPYLQGTTQLERVLIPKLTAIIKAFRREFISDLKSKGQSTALNNLQKKGVPDKLPRVITAVYRRSGLFGARLLWAEHSKYIKEARRQEQKAGFGINEKWIADVLNYLNIHLLGFIQDITETMRADIIRILEKGVAEGMSIDQIVKQLQSEGLVRARARVIARTEINRAANVGHSVGAQSLPYEVHKQWSAADDARTRHSHNLIDEHRVDEDEFFKVPIYKGDKNTGTFDLMQYPGDATASKENTINCRCRAIYLPKRDSRGRLVLRNQSQARVIPMRPVTSYTPSQIAAQLKSHIYIGPEK